MDIIWTLTKKELRLLVRDRLAALLLLAMPLLFILVLGLSLGEGFGQKPDDRLRVSLVDLDEGYSDTSADCADGAALWTSTPAPGSPLASLAFFAARRELRFPQATWAKLVQ